MTGRVVVAEAIGAEGMALLASGGLEPDLAPSPEAAAVAARLAGAAALIVRSSTRVTADLLAAGPSLQVVVRAGTGLDNIDLPAARARGIEVRNTPGANSVAVAEMTFALLLALARNLPDAVGSLAAGRWERERLIGFELRGKRLGLVGLGRIGAAVATRARAFAMEVWAHDPFLAPADAAREEVTLVPLAELLAGSDVISLHAPMTPSGAPLIGPAELRAMKPSACLVNCARGGLVDEQALLAALDAGQLRGAALDVFRGEPRPDPRLLAHPRIVATPHLGAATVEAREAVGVEAAREVLSALGAAAARPADVRN